MKNLLKRMAALVLSCFFSFSLIACSETQSSPSENSPNASHSSQSSSDCKHDYESEITREATCQKRGLKTYTCTLCGDFYTENIPKTTDHEYESEITREATCQKSGLKTFTCELCGDSYTESVSLEALSANEIFESSKNAVGEIITYNKSGNEIALGTGFVYGSNGKIITNYHVIEDAYSAKITINEQNYNVQSILAYDKTIDLAILKIEANGLPVLNVCDKTHNVGTAVYAFGSSKGLTATFSQGIITYADRELDGVHYIQHDAAISSGNSGGPLINEYGEVIGVNTMTIIDSQNLNFAISAKELSNLDYSTPLTFAQFYEKECDTFTKLKNYIVQNGTYDASDNDYSIDFDNINTGSIVYNTGATYDVTENEIELTIFIISDSMYAMVFLTIDQIDGIYMWSYVDSYEQFVAGTIYASTFSSNTVLTYTNYYGIYSTSTLKSARELASSMMRLLLTSMTIDYASIGIKASDLGFINF